jgi:AcrR family transcriptional regulator
VVTASGAPRPLRADARRNRARVLEAARSAFAAEGMSVPLDEIARRAGVGAGTVYRHFPTKEALFEAVILDRVQRLVEDSRSLRDADDPAAAFFEFLSTLATEATAKRELSDALAGSGVDLTVALADVIGELNTELEGLLRRAQAVGAVRGDVGIADLIALLKGILLAVQRHEGGGDLPQRLMAVIRDGLRGGA